MRLHPEVVAAREAQLELDRLVEAFWALVDEVNRLLELVAPPSFSDLGGLYALAAKRTFDGPLQVLKRRLQGVTESMRLLLSEHEHLSDQREAGWTGATEARSRAVELFDALRSVAVQSAMAVEAAAHFRLGASLAAKGADFTWPGWRAARRVADAESRAADLIVERMVQQIGDRRVPAEDMEHWAATTALRVNDLEFASRDDRGFLGSRFLAGLEIGLAVLGIAAAPLKGLGVAVRAATRARLGPLMRVGGFGGRAGLGGRVASPGGVLRRALPRTESGELSAVRLALTLADVAALERRQAGCVGPRVEPGAAGPTVDVPVRYPDLPVGMDAPIVGNPPPCFGRQACRGGRAGSPVRAPPRRRREASVGRRGDRGLAAPRAAGVALSGRSRSGRRG